MLSKRLTLLALLVGCRTTEPSPVARSAEASAAFAAVPVVDLYPLLATPPGSGVPWLRVEPVVAPARAPAPGAALADLAQHLSAADASWRERDPVGFALAAGRALGREAALRASADVRSLAGLYVFGGRAVALAEPMVRKSRVAPFVPEILRGPRFALLVTGDGGFEERPLHLLSEWAAHLVAAQVAVETRAGGERAREAVFGTLELTVYGLALTMAVAADDPRYFAEETAFAEVVAHLAETSMRVLGAAARRAPLARTMLLEGHAALTAAPEAEGFREFAARVYGREWANRVLMAPLAWPGPGSSVRDGPVSLERSPAVLQ